MLVLFVLCAVNVVQTLLQCPGNSTYFDFEECDPTRRTQCPPSFVCRRGTVVSAPDMIVHLCCDSSVMTITDWFTEVDLSPTYIPQIPLSKLPSVALSDPSPTAPVDDVHTGDEVVVLDFPAYVTASLKRVTFSVPPVMGGYLHFLVIIDPSAKPFAFIAMANVLWTGGLQCDLTFSQSENTFYASNQTLPASLSYRHQYVVLAYQTSERVSSPSLTSLVGDCTQTNCILTSSSFVQQLGNPIAGTLFYLTTVRTPFTVSDTVMRDQGGSSLTTSMGVLIVTLTLIGRNM